MSDDYAKSDRLVAIRLEQGAAYPYDAPDGWWATDESRPPLPASDWAHAAARGILADLNDRRGIKWELGKVDADVRAELVASLRRIILAAHSAPEDYLAPKPDWV